MLIVLRYLFRTFRERKLRSVLLVLSVAASAALYFASTALTTSLAGMYADRLQEEYGSAEIVVEPHPRFWSPLIAPAMADRVGDRIEYVVGVFDDIAYYRRRDTTVPLSLTAIEFDDLQRMNPIVLADEARMLPFRGHKAIISGRTAAAFGLAAGRRLTLEINGEIYRFRIAGIAHPTGMFAAEGERSAVIVPRDFMDGLFQARGLVEILYVKAKSGRDLDGLIAALEQMFRRHRVRPSVSEREAEEWTKEITIPLRIMFVLVLATSAFIIYSSFQVITAERLPIIGTFRGIGATRQDTNLVLFVESALYGIVGGGAGCTLGIVALHVMALWTTPEWIAGEGIRIRFTGMQLAVSFLPLAGLTRSYRDIRYDVEMWMKKMNRATDRHVLSVSGVSDVYGNYGVPDVAISDSDEDIDMILGIRGGGRVRTADRTDALRDRGVIRTAKVLLLAGVGVLSVFAVASCGDRGATEMPDATLPMQGSQNATEAFGVVIAVHSKNIHLEIPAVVEAVDVTGAELVGRPGRV